MKIECDKCGAKYSIADEKVRGKTFKIRCKKCSNVIIVRDTQAEAPAPEPEESAAVGWHLAIEGETVGPLSEEGVRERYEAGEIDKETAVWQEGFEDWISLGEAEAFADLPDQQEPAPREEDDPFAHAHADDYSAGVGASELGASLGAALSDAAAAAPADEPLGRTEDPRVSSLTGQRNENSVLFSLDNLQAMATASAGAATAAPKGLATAAPASEGSGLIDIRSMGSTLGSGGGRPRLGGGGGGGAIDDALPSFGGGGGFGGLAATPLVAQPTVGDAAGGKRSGTLLYAMIGVVVLLLGAVGFLAYIVMTKEPEVKVVKEQAPAPVMTPKDAKKDDAADEKEDEGKEAEDKGGTGADTGGGQEGVAGSGSSGTKRKTTKSRSGSRKSSSGGGGSSSGGEEPEPPSGGGGGGSSGGGGGGNEMDVDCILNPDLPKCRKSGKKKPSSSSSSGGGGSNLPDKLNITQIKAGMARVKAAAKSCGLRHGATSGEKVKVKVSISGSSGRVISASPEGPHAGKPLGNCVAAAAKKATFPKFKKEQMGVQYPFTM